MPTISTGNPATTSPVIIRTPLVEQLAGRSYLFSNETSLPGNTRLYLLEKKDFISYSLNSAGAVADIAIRRDWILLEGVRNLNFEVEPDVSRSGTLYQVAITFTVPVMSTLKTQLVDRLIEGEYVAMVQDRNSRWWVVGLDESIRYDKAKYGSTVDNNSYTITLGNKQRINQLEVLRSYVATMKVSAYADEAEPVYQNVNYYNYTTPTGGALNFKSVEYPPNNFVLSDETFALVTSGQTIYLPGNPKKGHQITVKDTGTGDVNPVIIKGGTYLIDGESEGYVNTSKGSITLVFVDSKWNTIQ